MLVPATANSPAEVVEAPRPRKSGEKAARADNALMQELLMEIRNSNKARTLEMEEYKASLATQQETIEVLRNDLEAVQRDNLGGGSESSGRSGDLHHLIKEKALMETSRGEWRSHLLEGVTLPAEWPVYEWLKHWSGRMTVVRALLALQELQKNKTIKEAVREMKLACNKLGRNISPAEHRLLVPVLEGKETQYEHDVWELCLLGVADLPYYIPTWMYICRTVKPVLVENTAQWNAIVAGGVWPFSCSDGFKIGRYKERLPFVQTPIPAQAASTTAVPPGTSTPGTFPQGRRARRFGRLGNY
jgi:hypothetical protein